MRRSLRNVVLFLRSRGVTSPTSFSGLSFWLDSSDASTLFQDSAFTTPATADTNPIGGWKDKSGNARNFTQATATNQPILKLSVQNGKNGVRFDGSNDRLEGGDLSAAFATAGTILIVYKPLSVATNIELYSSSNNDSYYRLTTDGAGYSGILSSLRRDGYPTAGNVPTSGCNLRAYRSSGSGYEIFTNNTSAGAQSASFLAGTVHRLGCATGGGVQTQHWNGDIYEIAAYGRALADSELAQWYSYAKAKWGTA